MLLVSFITTRALVKDKETHIANRKSRLHAQAPARLQFFFFFFFLVIAFVFVVFSTPGPFQKDSSTPCCSVGFYLPLLDTCSCPAAFAVTEEVAARLPPFCPWQVTQPAAQTLSEF